MSTAKMILGYWNIRGLAQPIRLLLTQAGVDFEDKRYPTLGTPPSESNSSDWLADKNANTFDLTFPNLPYLIDGDVHLTQTLAILRYLGRKLGFVGKTEREILRVELTEQQVADLRAAFAKLCYSPDFERLQEGSRSAADCLGILDGGFTERFSLMLRELSAFLADRKWFAGDRMTYVDFAAYEILFQMSKWNDKIFGEAVANLKDFMTRFEALPAIEAYLKSERYLKWPFNGDSASFGSRKQPCPF